MIMIIIIIIIIIKMSRRPARVGKKYFPLLLPSVYGIFIYFHFSFKNLELERKNIYITMGHRSRFRFLLKTEGAIVLSEMFRLVNGRVTSTDFYILIFISIDTKDKKR